MIKLKGKKVTLMGLGLHGGGVATAKFLLKAGAKLTVTDIKKADDLKDPLEALSDYKKQITFVLGQHRPEDFTTPDLIIKNPGVDENSRYLKLARQNGISIETDIGIFFDNCPTTKIVGVTGTKGKSSTAALLKLLIDKKAAKNVWLGGNIEIPALSFLDKIRAEDVVVLELSSFQLDDLKVKKVSPWVAVLTNIYRDHLDRHSSFEEYQKSKASILAFQKKDDYAVLNADDEKIRSMRDLVKGRILWYGSESSNHGELDAWIKEGQAWLTGHSRPIFKFEMNPLLAGRHNQLNALAAFTAAAKIFNLPISHLVSKLKKWRGMTGRMEYLGEFEGVRYYNDTAATIPEATQATLKTLASSPELRSRLILIAGGVDKGSDYLELTRSILTNAKAVVLFSGTASEKIAKNLEQIASQKDYSSKDLLIVKDVVSMEEAIKQARILSKPGDAILLSPAAASFNLFLNAVERGERFRTLVMSSDGQDDGT